MCLCHQCPSDWGPVAHWQSGILPLLHWKPSCPLFTGSHLAPSSLGTWAAVVQSPLLARAAPPCILSLWALNTATVNEA